MTNILRHIQYSVQITMLSLSLSLSLSYTLLIFQTYYQVHATQDVQKEYLAMVQYLLTDGECVFGFSVIQWDWGQLCVT